MNSSVADPVTLAQLLGDPSDPTALLNRRDVLAWDERSAFPEAAVEALDSWGLPASYVPTEFGGRLRDLTPPMSHIRRIAARDLTVAVAHGKTFLGAVCAWLVGGDTARRMAQIVLAGDPVSWGLTERGRGSDLVRSATRLVPGLGGFRLTGEKWPINNATRGRAMCALVRTRDEQSPTSLSLVLVDKHEVDPRGFESLRKVVTHGIRGADISGLRWHDTRVPPDAIMGAPGRGLELALKGLQLTRIACTALSLGAADRAVTEVLQFAADRQVADRPLGTYPIARAQLGGILADAFTAEAVALVGAARASTHPHELALVSALVKYVVPCAVDRLFRDATQFLGARALLTDYRGAGLFQKAVRDNRVVGIFDGSSVVSLNSVIAEFPAIARGQREDLASEPTIGDRINFGALRLGTRHGTSLFREIPVYIDFLSRQWGAQTPQSMDRFCTIAQAVLDEVRAAPRSPLPSAGQFDLARRVAEVFAGACCLAIASGATGRPTTTIARSPVWADAVLTRIVARLGAAAEHCHARSGALADFILESGVTPTLLRDGQDVQSK